ncbi:cytidylate kinase [Rhodomicrobium vannielii ATCC 17100]|uniref:Cytidylate kinase n=1 Tax=Rhodomicrobium vannielii (strain ATCC 17100 / DSM 162 / LMG 4299 / NCIMB 10020 / ATH 3.1.1) TaxID=648757 RepID=E3I1X0_RHOVT|nr:(d)CMP kinase [Rhodomicrobium vannielii]ADP70189.1 cytidylate kinase [Rhodomicrobium vannielii ATCC 17100]MBJ7535250.1 (d)CMP kinase [Rhodomicrobium vannielii ATCC 17100]
MIIAIDGTAAAGKSTLARRVAQTYGLPHLDTGSLYRAVARDVMAAGHSLEDARAAAFAAKRIDPSTLGDPNLRLRGNGEAASVVAAIPDVRAALLEFQRAFANQPGGAVVEGRDIGTVVCPDAEAKIFVTASAESRAARRHRELVGYGVEITEQVVLAEIKARDKRDSERAVSPLKPAEDALLLDTTELDIEKAVAAALHLIDKVARRG